MLQLIILGQIPGTHIQLTFAWLQVLLLPVVAIVSYRLYKAHGHKLHRQAQKHFDNISLQNLDQA